MKKNNKIRIIITGGTHRSYVTVNKLLEKNEIEILLFLIQKDYPWDQQWHHKLEKISQENNIPYEIYESGKKLSDETVNRIQKLSPDAIIGTGMWRTILQPEIWKTSRYGYIGLHGSLLPEYRGFANLNWYIINGENEYGMQMIQLDEWIDGGKLVCKKDGTPFRALISLEPDKTMNQIIDEVEKTHVTQTLELIDCIKTDNISFIEQDENKATWGCHRGPNDGEIDWTKNSLEIHNFIRAQSQPYP